MKEKLITPKFSKADIKVYKDFFSMLEKRIPDAPVNIKVWYLVNAIRVEIVSKNGKHLPIIIK